MCGIAGIIAKPGYGPLDPSTCERMCAAIKHRGPDDGGYWHSDAISLGMRRLSIIDVESGAQPIWISPSLGIIFNGEIYNYQALRAEMAERGVEFKTRSDTEVILRLYGEQGVDFVNHLDGMFALCIVDLGRKRLILARDRFGEKPLYFSDTAWQFTFASELKALMAAFSGMPHLDRTAISHFLTLRFVPQPLTMWKGVSKLLPGHYLIYDLVNHGWHTEAYWRTEFCARPVNFNRHYEEEFRDIFFEAVNRMILASDVPVGIFLSGGLDSTLITLAAKECGHDSLHTFSIGYDDPEFSEFGYAREVAKYFGTKHHEVPYTQQDFQGYLGNFPWASDEPLGDSASIPLHYLSKFARQWVKVTLTGEGADELLGGYDLEKMARSVDKRRLWLTNIPKFVFQLAALGFGKGTVHGRALSRMARNGWGDYVGARPAHPTHFFTETEKMQLFPSLGHMESTDDLIRTWYDGITSSNPMDKYMTVLCKSWLVEDLLMKADKMSMSASLELRCPFLDRKLTEWAQSLPLDMRFGNKQTGYVSKALLRKFAVGQIPESVIKRPKQGFPVPTYQWMIPDITRWVHELLEPADSGLRTVLGFSCDLDETVDHAAAGNVFAVQKIWLLVLLEIWLRRWVLNEPRVGLSSF